MKYKIMQICRVFLGIVFLGAGINGYFVIFDIDPIIPTSPEAMSLFEFKYLLIIEKALEVICGCLLLVNRFIPLTIAILTPIVANIFLLHLFVDHSLLLLATVLLVSHGYLLFYFRKNFMGLFERKTVTPKIKS